MSYSAKASRIMSGLSAIYAILSILTLIGGVLLMAFLWEMWWIGLIAIVIDVLGFAVFSYVMHVFSGAFEELSVLVEPKVEKPVETQTEENPTQQKGKYSVGTLVETLVEKHSLDGIIIPADSIGMITEIINGTNYQITVKVDGEKTSAYYQDGEFAFE